MTRLAIHHLYTADPTLVPYASMMDPNLDLVV
jgi:hypothetical protein